jgi:hypothetical protein
MSNVYDNHYIFIANVDNNTSTNSGDNIYIQDAQLVKGSSAKTYFPTTTRLNMPRVDYLNNSNGSLILEPQRSNLITYSSDFSQWVTQSGGTGSAPIITSNSAISPDGTQNADKIVFNKGTGVSTSDLSVIASSSFTTQTNTASFYIKADSPQKIVFRNSTNWQLVDVTTEWQRIDKTDTGNGVQIGLRDGYGISGVPNTATIYLWGFQAELGSYPTSIINTEGSSVTRNADACSITNVADRIGQTEGTMFLDFVLDSVDGTLDFRFQLYGNNSVNNWVFVGMTNGDIRAYVNDTTNQFDSSFSGVVGTRYKLALAYKENDFAFYANGIQKSVSTSGTIPSLDSVSLGDSVTSANMVVKESVNQAQIYNTRLSNNELEALTS